MANLPIKSPTSLPIKAAEKSISMLFDAWKEYKKVHEVEKTKRIYIESQKEVSLERIRSQRAVIEQYLTYTFQERSQVIKGMFETLDKGIETGNDQLINSAMGVILDTVKQSPLEGVKNLFNQIDDPNIDCIEI